MKSIKLFFTSVIILLLFPDLEAQKATISQELQEFKTYPFSDPDPVAEISRIYPYFYFHGYTNEPVKQKWNMVVMENEYIKVLVCPDIGGKVWAAIEKSTGNEFLYYNHVVKFRDVAMRGPWTSGGLEYNFGDIGHTPTCSAPVDYITKENADGSVSCIVGATDLPSGTRWNVEIKVSPGKAFFETKASWFNNTELPCSYYHWMNAAAKASDGLEFIYPGESWIGHGTETGNWPRDNGRDINWYKNNNFGSYKSYHVINSYSGHFGGYWHDKDFGFGHYSDYDTKPGKKLWIWGLAEEGMIWEGLLTDKDGQYIEYQAGKLFNQAANSSSDTPFKHKEFSPHDADIMNETWFPVKETGGMNAASEFGVLNIENEDNKKTILFSALQEVNDDLQIIVNDKLQHIEKLQLEPLKLFKITIQSEVHDHIKIILGHNKMTYSNRESDYLVDRPLKLNEEFSWESAYGWYTRGLELEKQRAYTDAMDAYQKSLEMDPGFLPALNRLALSHYRQMDYSTALQILYRSLAIDTYDSEANYILGLVSREKGDIAASKSGFSIAMGSVTYRSAAATELASLFIREWDWIKAKQYALKALDFNKYNLDALQTLAITHRKTGNIKEAEKILAEISALNGTGHFHRFEKFLISQNEEDNTLFLEGITNELPHESFLDLAIGYYRKACIEEAIEVLMNAPENPVIDLWLAFLKSEPEETEQYLRSALEQSPAFVFPHRTETLKIIQSLLANYSHWKLNYYLGLILWNKGLLDAAREQFVSCENEPDFAPFYLAKAKLVKSKEEKYACLLRSQELAPRDWRTALALSEYLINDEQAEQAMKLLEPFLDSHPEQSAIGLGYARSLSARQKYTEAISFLENYNVLPFEGATAGRDLYYDACVRAGFLALKEGKYRQTIQFAGKAKLWPVNLGVGRPYNVDERLEDYMQMIAYTSKGDRKNAGIYATKVMEYSHPGFQEENSRLYLQLKVLINNGKHKEAEILSEQYETIYPESDYIKWVKAKIAGIPGSEQIEKIILEGTGSKMPYDTRFVDRYFQLLLDFLEALPDE